VSDESTTVLQGFLERAITGVVAARQRLLELTRDRLMWGTASPVLGNCVSGGT
jgi:hypothetical protein